MNRAVLASLSCLVLLAASDAGAAPVAGCPAFDPPEVTVDLRSAPVARDHTRNAADLTAMPGREPDPAGMAGGRVLGLAWVRYGNAQEMTIRLARLPSGAVCAAPAQVRVTFGYEERRVFVARELPEGTCIHAEVLAHEMRHVETDDSLLATYRPRVETRLRSELRRITPVRASGEEEAKARIQAVMSQALNGLLRDFGGERSRLQARIDTLAEYKRVSASCNGELSRYLKAGEGRL
jgi:hypothetical protein